MTTIHLYEIKGKTWKAVEAEEVEVAKHLDGKFYVHRCPFAAEAELWKVSEGETGTCISQDGIGSETRDEAIEYAIEMLACVSPERFKKSIERAREMIGRRAWRAKPSPIAP